MQPSDALANLVVQISSLPTPLKQASIGLV